MASRVKRRTALKWMGGMVGAVAATRLAGVPAVIGKDLELVHWSWLTASDGEIWKQMIDNFNAANKDKGLQIRMEGVPDDQYGTKVLAAAATGNAPDFGWGTAGLRADWVKKGVASKDVVNWNQGDVPNQFLGGRAATMVMGPWQLANVQKSGIDFGIVTIPVPKEGQKPVVPLGGDAGAFSRVIPRSRMRR